MPKYCDVYVLRSQVDRQFYVGLILFALPAVLIARTPRFEIRHVWYLSVGSVIVQMCVNLLLLRRELRKKLRFEEPETFIPASATAS